ncbi:hypothetical protein KKF84_03360, partial [Myxococcota bacterium]|nr:hypothetical protein [Myxococcota bacterium]MBU1534329.1 hypothetical protein [Myxococcota bacterium]
MKKTLTILIALSVLSCSKGKKDKVDPEKAPKPMEMAPAMAVKTPPPVVKKAQTPCEKALNTLNKCLVKPPLSAKISLRLVAQCEHMAKGENALYKKDVQCLAAADGDCGKVEICLSPKTKPVCEIFADTRIKCRRRELKDSLKA